MKKKLHGKVVLVTGASSGIGKAVSLQFAQEGCRVGLLARRSDLLNDVAQQIRDQGGEAIALPADVLNEDQVQEAVKQMLTSWDRIDIAVANAGLGRIHRITNLTTEKMHQVMDLNFYGVWHIFEAVLPDMLNRGEGHLVGISSIASFRGMPKSGPYSASKAALATLMESARVELKPKGISCTVIHPGYVHTPLTDRNRMSMPFIIEADKAAAKMVKFIRQGRSEVVFPWQMALLMPLYRNLPNALYDLISKMR